MTTLTLLTVSLAAPALWGQESRVPEPLPADAPLGDPVVDADATFHADRVTAWQEGGARVLLLDGDAWFKVGAYGFRADRMVARLEPRRRPGERITHLAIYLDNARSLTGGGRVTAEAPRLLVTAATRGEVMVEADAFHRREAAPDDALVRAAAARVARYRQSLRQASAFDAEPQPLYGPEVDEVREARRTEIARQQLAHAVRQLPTAADAEPTPGQPALADGDIEPQPDAATPPGGTVLPTRGAVHIAADQLAGSTRDNTLMLIGDARVMYQSYTGSDRNVALKAEKIVVFLSDEPEEDTAEADAASAAPPPAPETPAPGANLRAGDIEGVYLEDNVVVTDGLFTVRAPRMYFDLQQNKAVLLDAVMYTYDVRRKVPLYVRAEMVKQTSATSFEAKNALLTTSEFAEPHVAIAADRLTLNRQPEGTAVDSFTASHNTIEVRGVPVFYWPYLAGINRDPPLKRISGGYSSKDGLELETWWDIFALAGQTPPDGVDALWRLDYMGDHGPATGLVADYQRAQMFGRLNSYLVLNDNGVDDIGGRRDVEHDGDTRGLFHWQHRQYLPNDLELSLETAYLSDETFLEEFFDADDFYESKEYETSAYLKKQEDDWAATFLAKYNINDFTPLTTTLQTPGYTVDKLPELEYYRIGTSFWDDRLTYFSETRGGLLRIRPGEDAPEDRGFADPVALELFGLTAATTFEDAFDAAGYPVNDTVARLDSRHEINAPMQVGIFGVTPYAVGRFTGYSEDFEEYAGEDEQLRLWGQVGTRAATRFVNTYERFESRLLDVHRLRHVIEPHANVFAAAANLGEDELPVFDYGVENIDDGAGVLFGLTNRLQTQRGGEGRWRSVDWIVVKTDLVLREDDDDPFATDEGEIARFFDYRPEYATGGDHFYTELLWLVTDTFGVTGELTHSFDTDQIVQWRLGGSIQHTPHLFTYAEYESYEELDLRLLRYGFTYQLTTKYRVGIQHRLDLGGSGAERVSAMLERKLPRWRVRLSGSYNESHDETTVGLILIPEGFGLTSPRIPLNDVLGAF